MAGVAESDENRGMMGWESRDFAVFAINLQFDVCCGGPVMRVSGPVQKRHHNAISDTRALGSEHTPDH